MVCINECVVSFSRQLPGLWWVVEPWDTLLDTGPDHLQYRPNSCCMRSALHNKCRKHQVVSASLPIPNQCQVLPSFFPYNYPGHQLGPPQISKDVADEGHLTSVCPAVQDVRDNTTHLLAKGMLPYANSRGKMTFFQLSALSMCFSTSLRLQPQHRSSPRWLDTM